MEVGREVVKLAEPPMPMAIMNREMYTRGEELSVAPKLTSRAMAYQMPKPTMVFLVPMASSMMPMSQEPTTPPRARMVITFMAAWGVKPSWMLRVTSWLMTPTEQIWKKPVVMAASHSSLIRSSAPVVQPPSPSTGSTVSYSVSYTRSDTLSGLMPRSWGVLRMKIMPRMPSTMAAMPMGTMPAEKFSPTLAKSLPPALSWVDTGAIRMATSCT